MAEADSRFEWVRERTLTVYSNLKPDKFAKAFDSEETKGMMREFFSNADVRCLVFVGDAVTCSLGVVGAEGLAARKASKGVVFLKPKSMSVTKSNVDQLVFSEVSKDPLTHLKTLLEDVYVPVLANPKNQEGWGEVVSKEVMDKVYGLLANVTITVGRTKGETRLPLPPVDLSGERLIRAAGGVSCARC